MDWTETCKSLSYLTEPPYLYAGGVVLALTLILILLLRRQPKNIVAYRTDNGRVMICRSAIVELVRTSCEQLEDVAKPNVKIRVKGKYTHFDVRIQLINGGNLRDIERTLQAYLRKSLTENLGIEHVGKINIVATGFKGGSMKKSNSLFAKKQANSLVINNTEQSNKNKFETIQDDTKETSV